MHDIIQKTVDYVTELEGSLAKTKEKKEMWRKRANEAEAKVDNSAVDALTRKSEEIERLQADNAWLNELVKKLVKGESND